MRVIELLKNTRLQLADPSESRDETAVRFHHRLVSIHPFPNGNGRHSRLMADLLITHLGEKPFTWGNKANLVNASEVRNTYLAALRAADNRNLQALLTFARS